MSEEGLERLKEHFSLLEYLQRHNWRGHRAGTRPEFVGLCPLHRETHPSFSVNTSKNVFYCHGCGRGGDLIRFVELFQHLSFRQSVDHLEQVLAALARSRSVSQLLAHSAAFYQLELHRHPEAAPYLERRDYTIPRSSRISASAMLGGETYAAIFLAWAIRSITCCRWA